MERAARPGMLAASLLALAAGCSDRSSSPPRPASNRPPVLGTIAPASGVVFETVNVALEASDPDGDALAFSLASAPPGLSVDRGTGVLSWVPALSQVGAHAFTIALEDGRGGTASGSGTITVAPPPGFPAFVALAVGASAYRPGEAVDLTWAVHGSAPPGTDLRLRAVAEQVVPSEEEASSIEWTLEPSGSWSPGQVNLASPAASGSLRVALPSPAAGIWRLAAELVSAGGDVLSLSSATVLVSDGPAVRLVLGRTIAGPLDRVRATVIEAAGADPREVRLMAWLVRPGGTFASLPLSEPNLEVRRGPGSNAARTLLDRVFTEEEAGDYEVHARLYDETSQQLLSEDSARFAVCAGRVDVTGSIQEAGGAPLDGTRALLATVRAIDRDDGAVTASSRIGADGRYTLKLDPGRYVIAASSVDADGDRQDAEADELVISCDGSARTVDLLLAPR